MSRSNPQVLNPNPSTKWFEWNGEMGIFKYYDKVKEEVQPVPLPFTFILLDELAVVRGWHEPSESGITSNEVRDTRSEPFVVKAFKGGRIAEGVWQSIKDRVGNAGGRFNSNLYIAYKEVGDPKLRIGSLMLHGAALMSYFDWRRDEGSSVEEIDGKKVPVRYAHAIAVKKFAEGKQGKVVYRYPVFELVDVIPESNRQAMELDRELQKYLEGYFKRTKVEQVDDDPEPPAEAPQPDAPADEPEPVPQRGKVFQRSPESKYEPQDDDVPF